MDNPCFVIPLIIVALLWKFFTQEPPEEIQAREAQRLQELEAKYKTQRETFRNLVPSFEAISRWMLYNQKTNVEYKDIYFHRREAFWAGCYNVCGTGYLAAGRIYASNEDPAAFADNFTVEETEYFDSVIREAARNPDRCFSST